MNLPIRIGWGPAIVLVFVLCGCGEAPQKEAISVSMDSYVDYPEFRIEKSGRVSLSHEWGGYQLPERCFVYRNYVITLANPWRFGDSIAWGYASRSLALSRLTDSDVILSDLQNIKWCPQGFIAASFSGETFGIGNCSGAEVHSYEIPDSRLLEREGIVYDMGATTVHDLEKVTTNERRGPDGPYMWHEQNVVVRDVDPKSIERKNGTILGQQVSGARFVYNVISERLEWQ